MRPVARPPPTTITMAKVDEMIAQNWLRAVQDGLNNGYLEKQSDAYNYLMTLNFLSKS